MTDDENRPERGGSRTSATKSLSTVPDPGVEWTLRLAEAISARTARRAARSADRAAFAAARRHGLKARHSAKLRRSGGRR